MVWSWLQSYSDMSWSRGWTLTSNLPFWWLVYIQTKYRRIGVPSRSRGQSLLACLLGEVNLTHKMANQIAYWSGTLIQFKYLTKFSPKFRPPFEYQTNIWMVIWISDYHLNTWQVKISYFYVSVFQMFVIQIPTGTIEKLYILKHVQKWRFSFYSE